MDGQIIERAVEAAAKADYEVLRRGHWDEQPDDFRDEWRSDVRPLVTAALAEVEASITAERDDLAARVARVEALAKGWHSSGERDMKAQVVVRPRSAGRTFYVYGAGMVEMARLVREAIRGESE